MLKFGSIAKGRLHDSCGLPFAKRDFCNFSKLPSSCQQSPEAAKSCCFALIPIVCHSISTRYPPVKIRPNCKGETTWLMWHPLCKTRSLQLFQSPLIMSAKARGYQILLFGVDPDCLPLDLNKTSTRRNLAR